ncbi:unnamed protein product [Pleuronectes platessa]|uniref:Uncharacterized protein n=1 Tax=Pleuronectes platessa TaxID=8262 RepID=A0A9N7TNB4_PLEPL|nr:unnamed protein product [Pleuronectes platessa]
MKDVCDCWRLPAQMRWSRKDEEQQEPDPGLPSQHRGLLGLFIEGLIDSAGSHFISTSAFLQVEEFCGIVSSESDHHQVSFVVLLLLLTVLLLMLSFTDTMVLPLALPSLSLTDRSREDRGWHPSARVWWRLPGRQQECMGMHGSQLQCLLCNVPGNLSEASRYEAMIGYEGYTQRA